MILVIMGVSGSGKTTIATGLARKLGWQYQEGDALHPPANVEKMKSGQPLSDADRLGLAGEVQKLRRRELFGRRLVSELEHGDASLSWQ